MSQQIYVITYEYSDKSGFGTVGAWASEEAARAVMGILETHGDISKVFKLKTLPVEVDLESQVAADRVA